MFYKNKKYNVTIRKATISEDNLIAQHFYQLWLDNKIDPHVIRSDWLEETIKFITQARQNLAYQAFVAVINNQVVGSSSCQLFAGLYPTPFQPSFRSYGYIWNVYVEDDYRRQGIATKLTKTAINYLHYLNCTHAILHASPHGKPLYESMGFVPKNEMVLELKK
jgi:GNAT superfamily N-acetyltransferase